MGFCQSVIFFLQRRGTAILVSLNIPFGLFSKTKDKERLFCGVGWNMCLYPRLYSSKQSIHNPLSLSPLVTGSTELCDLSWHPSPPIQTFAQLCKRGKSHHHERGYHLCLLNAFGKFAANKLNVQKTQTWTLNYRRPKQQRNKLNLKCNQTTLRQPGLMIPRETHTLTDWLWTFPDQNKIRHTEVDVLSFNESHLKNP